MIGRAGTGVDNVDVEAATRRGIVVVNAAGSNALSAAEHAIALLLAQARNIPQAHSSLVAGRWDRSKFGGVEVTGKTLGVLGFGRIGQMVAERAKGLGMRVDRLRPVRCRCPLPRAGRGQGRDPGGPLRGERLRQPASGLDGRDARVRRAGRVRRDEAGRSPHQRRPRRRGRPGGAGGGARGGRLGGAGIDVFPAGAVTESPLFGLPGVVVTPHLGASTEEAQDRAGRGRRRAGRRGAHRRRRDVRGQHPGARPRGARRPRAVPAAGAPARAAHRGAGRRRRRRSRSPTRASSARSTSACSPPPSSPACSRATWRST